MSDKASMDNPQFLSDAPAFEDQSNTLEPIVQAIQRVANDNSTGASIALVGPWGSGKSSVVKMLADSAKRDEKAPLCFVFDAWAHEGDPMRIALLRRLFEFSNLVAPMSPTLRHDLDKKLRGLTGKKTITATDSRSRLTPFALAMTLSLGLTPLGLELADPTNELPMLWLSYVLILSPILTTIAFLCLFRITRTGKKNEMPHASTHIEKKGTPLSLLDQSTTEDSIETHDTADPTSHEFQLLFKRLARRAVRVRKRHLIVVVDNLDRMSSQHTLTVWNTLRATFGLDTTAQKTGRASISLLVPFDEMGLAGVHTTTSDREEQGNKAQNLELPRDQNRDSNVAREFLEKTFQIVFRVPEYIPLSFRSFVSDRCQEAFGELDDKLRNALFHIYDTIVPTKSPRRVKAVVNLMVSQCHSCLESYDLRSHALYAVLWETRIDIPPSLKQPEQCAWQRALRDVLPEQWKEELAAIHFGVRKAEGLDLLYSTQLEEFVISQSLVEAELEELAEYRNMGHLLQLYVKRPDISWAPNRHETVMLLRCIQLATRHTFLDGEQERLTWQALLREVSGLLWLEEKSLETGEIIASLIRECKGFGLLDRDGCALLAKQFYGNLAFFNNDNDPSFRRTWLEGLEKVVEELEQIDCGLPTEGIPFPNEIGQFINLIVENKGTQPLAKCLRVLRPAEGWEIAVSRICQLLAARDFNRNHTLVVHELLRSGQTIDWHSVAETAGAGLPRNANVPERTALFLLLHDLSLAGENAASGQLQKYWKKGHLCELLVHLNTQKSLETPKLLHDAVLFGELSDSFGQNTQARQGLELVRSYLKAPSDEETVLLRDAIEILAMPRSFGLLLRRSLKEAGYLKVTQAAYAVTLKNESKEAREVLVGAVTASPEVSLSNFLQSLGDELHDALGQSEHLKGFLDSHGRRILASGSSEEIGWLSKLVQQLGASIREIEVSFVDLIRTSTRLSEIENERMLMLSALGADDSTVDDVSEERSLE